jgi:hypothetical protein
MVERRSDKIATTQSLLEESVRAPVDWPAKTVNLERDSLMDYRQRPMTGDVSVAELYHENSKLNARLLRQLRASKHDVHEFRASFLQRRADAVSRSGLENLEPRNSVRELLHRATSARSDDLYAVELAVLQDGVFAIHEPRSAALQIVKRLLPAESAALSRAVRLTAPPDLGAFGGIHLFLLANFARNEVLFGARGYRRTLIEAGQVAQRLTESAAQLRLSCWPVYDFADRDIDTALELDGTERSVLVAFEVMGEI